MLSTSMERKLGREIVEKLLPEVIASHYGIDPEKFVKDVSATRKIMSIALVLLILVFALALTWITIMMWPEMLRTRPTLTVILIVYVSEAIALLLSLFIADVYVQYKRIGEAYYKLGSVKKRYKDELIALTRKAVKEALKDLKPKLVKEYENYLNAS